LQPRAFHPVSARKSAAGFFGQVLRSSTGLEAAEKNEAPYARIERSRLAASYRLCQQLTRNCSKTFYFSSLFLPSEERRTIWAVYAFCRTADDIVDAPRPADERLSALKEWREQLIAAYQGHPRDPIMLAFADAVSRFAIPIAPALDLLIGAERDVTVLRYQTFEELLEYCRLVASTVGLLTAPVLGYEPGALPYGVILGQAMQMTNILRDVGEDARMGRIYLPAEDLVRFGYSEDSLLSGKIDKPFVTLMQFEIARVRALYEAAAPGIALLSPRSRKILDEIERNRYDVFTRRAHVPPASKIAMAAQLILRSR
jgi:phytoene synthase